MFRLKLSVSYWFTGNFISKHLYQKTLVTPLGHSFTCEEAIVRIDSDLSLVLLDVEVQAFTLGGGNFPRGKSHWDDNIHNIINV